MRNLFLKLFGTSACMLICYKIKSRIDPLRCIARCDTLYVPSITYMMNGHSMDRVKHAVRACIYGIIHHSDGCRYDVP